MISQDELIVAMQERSACRSTSEGFLVATDCLYPSNKVVQVEVSGTRTFTVSDRSGAVDLLSSHGVTVSNPARTLAQFAQPHGLSVSNAGAIYISDVSYDMLPLAVMLVANASKDAAMLLLDKTRFSAVSEFKEELTATLRRRFKDRVRDDYQIAGASTKTHVFEHAIKTDLGGLVLIDSATDDGNSINAVIVSNIDVKLAKLKNVLQRIVYDDRTRWRSESLLLLEEGASVVAFTKMLPALEGLVYHKRS